jgi:hypothetical protein
MPEIHHNSAYRVFVSYRRSDSWGWTGRIYDRLCEQFGEESIFMDVEGLSAGVDFRRTVLEIIAGSDVAMVVIGSRWLTAADDSGTPRLHDENDLVRGEIREALIHQRVILPVLVENAVMPSAQQLPPDIAPLAALNALGIYPETFRRDVDGLCESIRNVLTKAESERVLTPQQRIERLKRNRDELDDEIKELERQIAGDLREAEAQLRAQLDAGRPAVDPKGVAERPYDAFMVYGHARDRALAATLQETLQRFATPWHRVRALRIFRDRANLAATPNLWGAISDAVDRSKYMIYLASPESAASVWVNRELQYWLTRRSPNELLIVHTGGSLVWNNAEGDFDWELTTALPPILKGQFASEPLWIDLTWVESAEQISPMNPRFADAVATLSAALRGVSKSELIDADVLAHRRRFGLASAAAVVLLGLLAALAFLLLR